MLHRGVFLIMNLVPYKDRQKPLRKRVSYNESRFLYGCFIQWLRTVEHKILKQKYYPPRNQFFNFIDFSIFVPIPCPSLVSRTRHQINHSSINYIFRRSKLMQRIFYNTVIFFLKKKLLKIKNISKVSKKFSEKHLINSVIKNDYRTVLQTVVLL